ncbi:hypothetical protein AQ490_16700 [Wenjunlia vitaminophila]|uniref:Major facilitator superfamily (MFS) profile domain-containing protein n=1 Tax=Wenjunlia vitaminophila TaxID=76728 RepID=A0A0T6LY40_WENVI|nr:MFS transporter [Wenjunlia vitaminophila]KRV50668.1 hypothetical protein AQ490_16615 [Wenjunlia vitaminophila]KRV50683.1 hypothetical protein AQ490_16700 [Wenjunlia vitaminophila]
MAAAAAVPQGRRSRAVALMFIGLSTATVLGVPGGTLLGGKAGDRHPDRALPVILLLLALVLVGVAQAGPDRALTIVLLGCWGVAGFALVPALQARVVAIAGPASTLASDPRHARDPHPAEETPVMRPTPLRNARLIHGG